ncbi:MAG: ATP-binding cassette domain-containing protein [Acidobacteria bacterium]|nr:ATP-binding cassette domain-containing protein [Acidobacteriota bacterium]
MSQSPPAIAVESVTKRYGDFTAVDSISFNVPPGTIFGILGPNGAGKTTTIRMIMNITIPDEGKITILGRPSTDAAARAIGYLPEERGLYRKMKVLEHIVFLGEIRGLDRAKAKKRGAEWLERVGLTQWADKKVEELSKGMQQKVQFIGTVIHEPEILILDEPFSGLDPVNARALKDLFLEMRDQGRTLVLCTHVMEQAEKLCDEIALINLSKLVLQGTLGDIKKQFSGNRLILRGAGEDAAISALPGVIGVARKDGALEVENDPALARGDFLREAARAWSLDSAMPHEVSLDEIFVNVVGRSVGDVEAATGKEKAE